MAKQIEQAGANIKPPKRRYVLVDKTGQEIHPKDNKGKTVQVLMGRTPDAAAKKAAKRGFTEIRLREKAMKRGHGNPEKLKELEAKQEKTLVKMQELSKKLKEKLSQELNKKASKLSKSKNLEASTKAMVNFQKRGEAKIAALDARIELKKTKQKDAFSKLKAKSGITEFQNILIYKGSTKTERIKPFYVGGPRAEWQKDKIGADGLIEVTSGLAERIGEEKVATSTLRKPRKAKGTKVAKTAKTI